MEGKLFSQQQQQQQHCLKQKTQLLGFYFTVAWWCTTKVIPLFLLHWKAAEARSIEAPEFSSSTATGGHSVSQSGLICCRRGNHHRQQQQQHHYRPLENRIKWELWHWQTRTGPDGRQWRGYLSDYSTTALMEVAVAGHQQLIPLWLAGTEAAAAAALIYSLDGFLTLLRLSFLSFLSLPLSLFELLPSPLPAAVSSVVRSRRWRSFNRAQLLSLSLLRSNCLLLNCPVALTILTALATSATLLWSVFCAVNVNCVGFLFLQNTDSQKGWIEFQKFHCNASAAAAWMWFSVHILHLCFAYYCLFYPPKSCQCLRGIRSVSICLLILQLSAAISVLCLLLIFL